MGTTAKTSRLDHFLEAYQPLGEEVQARIWDRVHRAGWSANDPLSLQIAHETIMESRLVSHVGKMAALPGQLEAAVQSALDQGHATRARASMAERQAIAAQIAQEAATGLQATLPRLETLLLRRAALRLGLTFVLLSLMAGLAGYLWGRHDTGAFERQFAAYAERADAKTWISVLELNGNLDVNMAQACTDGGPGLFLAGDGRRACSVPLWLEAGPRPESGTVLDFASAHLASLRSHASALVILLIGGLFGAAARPLLRRVWHSQKDADV